MFFHCRSIFGVTEPTRGSVIAQIVFQILRAFLTNSQSYPHDLHFSVEEAPCSSQSRLSGNGGQEVAPDLQACHSKSKLSSRPQSKTRHYNRIISSLYRFFHLTNLKWVCEKPMRCWRERNFQIKIENKISRDVRNCLTQHDDSEGRDQNHRMSKVEVRLQPFEIVAYIGIRNQP